MHRRTSPPSRGLSRRNLLKSTAAVTGAAIGSGAVTGFPTIWAQNIKDVVLFHAGPPVTAIPAIAEQANKDLGFKIQMQATEQADLLNRFLSQSSSIDCADVSIRPVVKVPLGFDSKHRACFALPLSFSALQTRHSY